MNHAKVRQWVDWVFKGLIAILVAVSSFLGTMIFDMHAEIPVLREQATASKEFQAKLSSQMTRLQTGQTEIRESQIRLEAGASARENEGPYVRIYFRN